MFRIEQWRTYAGLLCGTPTRGSNDERLTTLPAEARERYGVDAAIVISPTRRSVITRHGDCEWLPAITCVAVFDSTGLARADSEPYSSLAIAWLQPEFALPIDAAVLDAIRAIDWEGKAVDWCW